MTSEGKWMGALSRTLADSGGQEAPTRESRLLPSSAGEQGALQPSQPMARNLESRENRRFLTEALSDWDIMVAG